MTVLQRYITLLLRRLSALNFDLLVRRVDRHPGNVVIPHGELWLVSDHGVKKWACFSCPGGCGTQISLSLNPHRRPHWDLTHDLWMRPTISPSVWQRKQCQCHFWIRDGKVEWFNK